MSVFDTFLGAMQEIGLKAYGLVDPAPREFLRALPDSLFLGSSLFALITQNFSLGILVLGMMEIMILTAIVGGFISAFQTNSAPISLDQCIAGLPSMYQITAVGHLLQQTVFPSGPILFVVAVLSYILFSILNFRDELTELGKKESEWKLRIPLASVFSSALIIAYCVFRVYYNCDSVLVTLGSALFGVGFGYIIYILHTYLFGRDSINLLGLPLLADRAAQGRPLYVCAKQKQ